jgi:hypothetical protein
MTGGEETLIASRTFLMAKGYGMRVVKKNFVSIFPWINTRQKRVSENGRYRSIVIASSV